MFFVCGANLVCVEVNLYYAVNYIITRRAKKKLRTANTLIRMVACIMLNVKHVKIGTCTQKKHAIFRMAYSIDDGKVLICYKILCSKTVG